MTIFRIEIPDEDILILKEKGYSSEDIGKFIARGIPMSFAATIRQMPPKKKDLING
jgi:hypothetical protein